MNSRRHRSKSRSTGGLAGMFLAFFAFAGCVRVAPPQSPSSAAMLPARSGDEVEADVVIDRWVRALGGAERLASLRNLERQWLVSAGTGQPSSLHTIELGLERMRFDEVVSGEVVNQGGFDGTVDWCDMGERGVGYQITTAQPYRYWHAPSTRASLVARQYTHRRVLRIDGEDPTTVTLGMNAHGVEERWTFDRSTGQLVRLERPKGLVVQYGDYRICDGVALPFSVVCEAGGAQVSYRCLSAAADMDIAGVEFSPPRSFLERSDPVERIMRRHLESRGGESAWRALTSRVTKAIVSGSASRAPTQLLLLQKGATRIAAEMDQPGLGKSILACDGSSSWEDSEIRGFRPLRGAEASRPYLYASMAADPLSVLSYPLRKGLGRHELNGRETVVVQLSSYAAPAGKFYFAVDNGMLLCFESSERPPSGGAPLRIFYSDYRSAGQVVMPFQVEYVGAEERTTVQCESIEHGIALEDVHFSPPGS